MSINVPELDATIDKMLGPAQGRMQALGAALNGAGPEVAVLYKSLTSMASGMVAVGKGAAESIIAVRNNQELPREFRLTETSERHDAAKVMLKKLNDGAHAAHSQLESALMTALLPTPHRDTSTRMLIRDEIRTRFSRLQGDELVSAVTKSLGANELHDSEILGSFGSALLESAGAAPDHVKAIRTQAVEKYLTRTEGGTKQQAAARKALTTMREMNIVGHLAAYNQAAAMHLSKSEGWSPSPQAVGPVTGRDIRPDARR